jgi:hypothetical protein
MRGEIRRQLFYSRGCHLVFAGLFLTVLDDRYDQPLQGGTRYAQPFSAAVLFHPSAAFGTDQVLGRHLAILRRWLKQQLRRWLKRLQKAPQMGGEEVSPKCRLGDAICYAVGGASRGVLGFLPSDNPFGDGRCRGAESVRLRAQRLSGTAARAGRYSTGACGLERAAARTRRLGRVRPAATRSHGRYSTGACGLKRAAARTRRLGRVRRAADIAGHHCEDRVRRARQSRRHARPEKAVFPGLAAAIAVRSTPFWRACSSAIIEKRGGSRTITLAIHCLSLPETLETAARHALTVLVIREAA